jgi:hypothetical protein
MCESWLRLTDDHQTRRLVLFSHIFDTLSRRTREVSVVHCYRVGNIVQSRDTRNERNIHEMEAPIMSPDEEIRNNAFSNEDHGNRLSGPVMWGSC